MQSVCNLRVKRRYKFIVQNHGYDSQKTQIERYLPNIIVLDHPGLEFDTKKGTPHYLRKWSQKLKVGQYMSFSA